MYANLLNGKTDFIPLLSQCILNSFSELRAISQHCNGIELTRNLTCNSANIIGNILLDKALLSTILRIKIECRFWIQTIVDLNINIGTGTRLVVN